MKKRLIDRFVEKFTTPRRRRPKPGWAWSGNGDPGNCIVDNRGLGEREGRYDHDRR